MIEALKTAIYDDMSQNSQIIQNLGQPLRLFEPPVKHAFYPYAIWRRIETKPIAQDYGTAQEVNATIEIVCKNSGQEDAKKAVNSIASWAQNAKPSAVGVNIVLVMCTYCDVLRTNDGRSFYGIARLKIIIE